MVCHYRKVNISLILPQVKKMVKFGLLKANKQTYYSTIILKNYERIQDEENNALYESDIETLESVSD